MLFNPCCYNITEKTCLYSGRFTVLSKAFDRKSPFVVLRELQFISSHIFDDIFKIQSVMIITL